MHRTRFAARVAFASLLTVVMLTTAPARAGVQLHRLFRDNAVLQRGVKLAVWGTTDKSEKVTVSAAGQEVSAEPKDGKWRVQLAPLSAGAPFTMTVTQGSEKVELKNLLAGEVWICGGQSNMQWAVKQSAGAPEAIAASANDKIRLFTVERRGAPQPESDVMKGEWSVCGPQTVPEFTAVGYFFGRDLQKALGVPVGLINSNIGGTTAERWMRKEAIESNADLAGITSPQGASDLYNAMIVSLAPYAIAGAIWYQGESNAERAIQYRKLMPAMIKSWRDTFGQGDFPFLMVQLAPFKDISPEPQESDWAELREAQLMTVQTTPKVGMAVITDVGEEKDIHPQKKEPVGARLAIAARAIAYGEKIEPIGPVFDKMTVKDGKAVLTFTHLGGGLVAKDGELKGFTIAGDDKKFVNALAKVDGDTVVVSSDKVAKPAAVRFGWANFPVVNLWSKAGLPATPFRTDSWPAVTDGKK
jgi:sialate O-acetylesterase